MQNYKKLMGSISIVTASYAASRLLVFFREILLAKWTGVSGATDTLDLAFIIPAVLFYLSAGGYLAITLIPLMSSKSEEELNNYKDSFKLYDFTDMIEKFNVAKLCPKYDVVFVDEAQDLSPIQWKMVSILR